MLRAEARDTRVMAESLFWMCVRCTQCVYVAFGLVLPLSSFLCSSLDVLDGGPGKSISRPTFLPVDCGCEEFPLMCWTCMVGEWESCAEVVMAE